MKQQQQQQQVCKNCVLIDGSFGIELNSEGICNYCEDPTYKTANWWKIQITSEAKEAGLKDWNSTIEYLRSRQGEKNYDCMVGFSGGKDSTALLYKMVHDYGLNPLAVTIDSGFIPEIAFENVRDTLEKIKIDHIIIDGAKETFRRLYQWVFTNQGSDELTLTRNLCDNCGDLVHSLVVREAMERNIEVILFGYSPDEIRRYFYEIPRDEIVHDWFREQEFYEDIENLIYTFIQYKIVKGSPKDNPKQRNLYYHFKVKQNVDSYSKYLGLTIFEEQEKYFNNSDYILRTTEELWYRTFGADEQRLLTNYKNIKNIDSIIDYLKILRDYWKKSYGKIFFRRKLKQKISFFF